MADRSALANAVIAACGHDDPDASMTADQALANYQPLQPPRPTRRPDPPRRADGTPPRRAALVLHSGR